MNPKTERFEMRLDPEILNRVDAWRGLQDDVPSRAEAIRRLVVFALDKISSSETIAFTKSEKLIIGLLCDIYKRQNIDDGFDPDFIRAAVLDGHNWALEWQYQGLANDHIDKNEVRKEVLDILSIWELIERTYKGMSTDDKEYVKVNLASHSRVEFDGFAGNFELEHLSIARFLIDEMDRFTHFKGRDLDAHFPVIDGYRRMLDVFRTIRGNSIGKDLSASEIVQILQARVHPSNRKS